MSPGAALPVRRATTTVDIGGVLVGSGHPIVVQSMTNTDTADADATAIQVAQLAHAGSELVRVTVNTDAAAQAVPVIRDKLDKLGVGVPIIGDFHYNGHLLLTKYPDCAAALAKYRINPGNVGTKRHDEQFRQIVEVAIANGKPVRIGVNWGSLDQQLLTELMDANAASPEPRDSRDVMIEAMLESALRSATLAEETGLGHDRIIISAKVSGVPDLVEIYRLLAARCDYPLHLGLTEAGMGAKGIIGSTAGLAILLEEASATRSGSVHARAGWRPDRGGSRSPSRSSSRSASGRSCRRFQPAPAAGARPRPSSRRWRATFRPPAGADAGLEGGPSGRRGFAGRGDGLCRQRPGESRHADIGISLPGTFEEPVAPVYVDGALRTTLRGDDIVPRFLQILDEYVAARYPGVAASV